MKDNIVSFERGVWTEEDKTIIVFALRRFEELEKDNHETRKAYEAEQNMGILGKIKRQFS